MVCREGTYTWIRGQWCVGRGHIPGSVNVAELAQSGTTTYSVEAKGYKVDGKGYSVDVKGYMVNATCAEEQPGISTSR